MKYVKTYQDRHGRLRHYFRRAGYPDIPLPGDTSSPEFYMTYAAALAGNPPPRKKNRQQRIEDTLIAIIAAFDHLLNNAPHADDWAARGQAVTLLREIQITNGNGAIEPETAGTIRQHFVKPAP